MRIYDVFKLNIILTKILGQQSKFNINLAYRLYKLRKKLDEIEGFAMERFETLFGNGFDSERLTENERMVYNTILSTEIDEELPKISFVELMNELEIKVDVEDIGYLEKVLS